MKRTLAGLYNYNYDSRHQQYFDNNNNYAWLFDILFPDGQDINRFHQDELYGAFRHLFVKSDKWFTKIKNHPLFDFDKSNIETLISGDRMKKGEVEDKIRFWNNSYGLLGEPENNNIINAICQDINSGISDYIARLDRELSVKENFLCPINNLLRSIHDNKEEDPISLQSYKLGSFIFGEDDICMELEDKFSRDKLRNDIFNARVFTESLILCLLFGSIDAEGNWDFIKKYVRRRRLGEDTIDFTVKCDKGTIFDSKNQKVRELERKGRYLMSGSGGAGKSYALTYMSLFTKNAIYVNLNEQSFKEKYYDDIRNNRRYNHLKDFSCETIFIDSLNEIMYNRELYVYICKDINELEQKTIIVASRYDNEGHELLNEFDSCTLNVAIDSSKKEKLSDALSLYKDLKSLLDYPLFYKLAVSMNNEKDKKEGEFVSKKNQIKSRFEFFCRYLKQACKPSMKNTTFVFSNLLVLPKLAATYEYSSESGKVFKDRIQRFVTEYTESDDIFDDSDKKAVPNEYARKYINTLTRILGFKNVNYSGNIDRNKANGMTDISSDIVILNKVEDRYGFKHETIHHFLVALDYIVRFKLAVEYALDGSKEEHENVFNNKDFNLLINNTYSEIDYFLIDYFRYRPEDGFEKFFDRITSNICKKIGNDETGDNYRAFGILNVLETSVELAVIFKLHGIYTGDTCKAVRKYCNAGLKLLKKTRILKKDKLIRESKLITVLGGLLERNLQYYRLYDLDKYEAHIEEYKEEFDVLKKHSPVIRNQLYKFQQARLQKQYSELLKDNGFNAIVKAVSDSDNRVPEELRKELKKIKADISLLMSDLENNFYEMSYNLLAVMMAYPNLSLLSLGYVRNVKEAFLIISKMIRESERKGTFLQYTYTLAYRLLLFDIKINDSYADCLDDELGMDDIEVRDAALSTEEKGTIAFLNKLRRQCGGLAEDSIKSMQLIEDYLLCRRDRKEEKAFIKLDVKSKEYLPYMTLKFCMIKNKRSSANFSLVTANMIEDKITNDIKKMLDPDSLLSRVSFENTNCLYNIMFSLKLLRRLNNNSKKNKESVDINSREFVGMFMSLVDADSDAQESKIKEIVEMFLK